MRRAWGHQLWRRYLHCKHLKLGGINLMQQAWYFKPLFSKGLTDSIKWSLSLNALLSWSLHYLRNEKTVMGDHSSYTFPRLMLDFHHAVLHTVLFPYRKRFSSFNFLLQTHLILTAPGSPWLSHTRGVTQNWGRRVRATADCRDPQLFATATYPHRFFFLLQCFASNSSPLSRKLRLRVARLHKYAAVRRVSFV